MRVVGFGDPVLDLISHVSYETIISLQLEAGGCSSVSQEELEQLLSHPDIRNNLKRHPGGSAANVCKGLAGIGSGTSTISFVGMVGKDASGQEYKEGLSQQGIQLLLLWSTSGAATASCLCLVTPDGQRTMRTFLGASIELNSPDQLPAELQEPGLTLLHFEGYSLFRAAVSLHAMNRARAAGAKISWDLASFEVVRGCWSALQSFLDQGLIDLLFCNEDEAKAVCIAADLSTQQLQESGQSLEDAAVHLALKYLQERCDTVVISRGKKGCIASSRDGHRATSAASAVNVVDTVGAGDHFTAGFLHAWLHKAPLQACTDCACAAGTAAVLCNGANLDAEALQQLRNKIGGILHTCAIENGSV